MASGATISAFGHGALLIGAVVSGYISPPPPLPLGGTEVSVISSEDFAALTQPVVAPLAAPDPIPDITPEPDPVIAAPPAEELAPEPDVAPDPIPEPEPEPEPEPVVIAPPVEEPPVEEELALLPPPDAPPLVTPVPDALTDTPAPPDATRVAPIPRPERPPDIPVAEEVVPPVSEEADTTEIEPERAPGAPEEATTEIVTEAETPGAGGAVPVSLRPQVRPRQSAPSEPDTEVVTPAPETPPRPTADSEAINTAIADALSGVVTPAPGGATGGVSGPPLTRGERDGLRLSVQACWNTGALSTDALNTTVVVGVTMQRDGRPDAGSIRLIQSDGGSEAATRQAFEAARRAIIRCGTRGYDLPEDKFEQWRDVEMTFNPERMRIR